MKPEKFEIFIACIPGLERELLAEIKQIGFNQTRLSVGELVFLEFCATFGGQIFI